jgi:transposase
MRDDAIVQTNTRGRDTEFMQGKDWEQAIFFPDKIDDYIEENNAARMIDALANGLDPHELGFARHEPKETGRLMYDPKDMTKLYMRIYEPDTAIKAVGKRK